ncbi:MAG: class I SAM-dependent RNA methyltransferase [Myxococcales bacterium]|nr:class I SAM-dependent RNA methyltransferase [Myxococcales bacterium]
MGSRGRPSRDRREREEQGTRRHRRDGQHRPKQKKEPNHERSEEIGQIHTVEIRDLSAQGQGVGRDDQGRAVFIPLTAPGDRVQARVTSLQPRYWQGELVEILEGSSQRAEPQCHHFGTCGGCEWQHLASDTQREAKQQILFETLRRIGKIEVEDLPKIAVAPKMWSCRDRARLHVDSLGKVGFFARASRQHIPVSLCPILHPSLQNILTILQEHVPKLILPLHEICMLSSGEMERSQAKSASETTETPSDATFSYDSLDGLFAALPTPTSAVLLSFHLDVSAREWNTTRIDDAREEFASWLEKMTPEARGLIGASLWLDTRCLLRWGEEVLQLGEEGVRYRAEGFAQANFQQNQVLREAVRQLVQRCQPRHLVEIYAGSGNLTFAVAPHCERVLALEGNPQAVEDAQQTWQELQASKQTQGAVLDVLRFDDRFDTLGDLCSKMSMRVDALLVDPPRRGIAKEMMQQIHALAPPNILYVSCDPATLARDMRGWIERGYHLKHLEIVDLMPQTAHLEAVVWLQRNHAQTGNAIPSKG